MINVAICLLEKCGPKGTATDGSTADPNSAGAKVQKALQSVGDMSVPALEDNRRKVLQLCGLAVDLGIALSLVSFVGGLGSSSLEWMGWVQMTKGSSTLLMGLRYYCLYNATAVPMVGWQCGHVRDINCDRAAAGAAGDEALAARTCQHCKPGYMLIPVAIALLAYFKTLSGTAQRWRGKDTPMNKVGTSASSILGGLAMMGTVLLYRLTCIWAARRAFAIDDVSFSLGNGCIFLIIATWLKILVGLVHLGLSSTTEDVAPQQDDTDSEDEETEVSEDIT
eukprot:TRINITY_DN120707_c0_g1_i1.p1 TRINITY_DN120707_c0_g1~~TRINITY_DN120707_c0_g1_i1.p1  ORF type:complete len:280 (+),score=46.84 TRINITY_DN120707_c0_g1_i1:101-940(+)